MSGGAAPPLGVKRFVRYWLPVAVYCAAIFVQSSLPASKSVPDWPGSDKLLHGLAYAILGALFFRAYRATNRATDAGRALWISILFAALYGITDEVHQYFVPERSADWLDAAADMAGGAVGAWICRHLTDEFRRRKRALTDR